MLKRTPTISDWNRDRNRQSRHRRSILDSSSFFRCYVVSREYLPRVVDLFCSALVTATPVAEAVVERNFFVPRVAKRGIFNTYTQTRRYTAYPLRRRRTHHEYRTST